MSMFIFEIFFDCWGSFFNCQSPRFLNYFELFTERIEYQLIPQVLLFAFQILFNCWESFIEQFSSSGIQHPFPVPI